jgi:hypothetical protein
MKKIFLVIFIYKSIFCFAQPGAFGSNLIFTIRDFHKNNYSVFWYDNKTKKNCEVISVKDKFIVNGLGTPVGGTVEGYIKIYNKKDTMVVFPPISSYENIVLDIPFRNGNFKIPNIVYETQKLFKPEYRKFLYVNLDGDWSDFEIGKETKLQNLVMRKVESFKENYLSSLLPNCEQNNAYSYNPYYLKDYFVNDQYYKKINGNSINNSIPKLYNYYFFGILKGTNEYFLQRTENGQIEYGELKVILDDEYEKKILPDLREHIYFNSYYIRNYDEPLIFGYFQFRGKVKYESYSTHQKWGIYRVYIEKPNLKTIKKIKQENKIDEIR